MRKLAIIFGIMVMLALSGCVKDEKIDNNNVPVQMPGKSVPTPNNSQDDAKVAESELQNLRIFYYYHPRCPNCQAVEPMINFLANNTSLNFVICNVQHFSNCTQESRALALAVRDKTGFFGTPTAVVEVGGNYTVFIGKFEIMEMVKFLGNYSDLPEVRLNQTNYSIEECIACHEERGLNPPSTYTCSYCCHGI